MNQSLKASSNNGIKLQQLPSRDPQRPESLSPSSSTRAVDRLGHRSASPAIATAAATQLQSSASAVERQHPLPAQHQDIRSAILLTNTSHQLQLAEIHVSTALTTPSAPPQRQRHENEAGSSPIPPRSPQPGGHLHRQLSPSLQQSAAEGGNPPSTELLAIPSSQKDAITADMLPQRGAQTNLRENPEDVEYRAHDMDNADEGSAAAGNRWPREETIALLKVRADMDAAFRDSNVKGPLWEEVSRKLKELGYVRSAKKCKEKFENVNKYYKRTKEGKVGRQDGKAYRFFTQLEALSGNLTPNPGMNSSSLTVNTTAFATVGSDSMVTLPPAPTHFSNSTSNQINNLQAPPPQPSVLQSGTAPNISVGADSQDYSLHLKVTNVADVSGFPPTAVSIHLPHPVLGMAYPSQHPIANPAQLPRYSDDDEDDEDDSIDDDDTEDNEDEEPKFQPGPPQTDDSSFVLRHSEDSGKRKRKRPTNMMAFFESLFEMVIDRQEKMQRKFFEAMEKRESDRMIREEAWRRQEMAMLSREHELRVQEQNSAAARDAALIAFLQKVTGQPVDPVNAMGAAPIPAQPVIAPIVTHSLHSVQPPHSMQSVQPLQSQYSLQTIVPIAAQPVESPYPSQSSALISVQPVQSAPPLYEDEISHQYEDHEFSDSNSKRWLKPEVLHLIELHNSLRAKFSEAGPKGPLWEAIANGMAQKGYPSRTAKRCKEKWENINKYFKRAKESNKKRPENSKTCPYFHELDALYSRKSSSQVHHGPMERVQGDNINIYQQPIANSGEGLANCNYEEQPNTISNSIPADQPGTSGGEVLASSDSNNHIIGSANATMAGVNASNGFMHNVVPMQLAVEAYQGLDASNASAHTPGHRFPVEVGPSMHQRLSITENHQDKQAAEISTTSRELEKAQTMAPQFQVQ